MVLKVNLTEKGLFVNKYKCRSVTIYETEEGYEATMLNINGITKTIPKLNRLGKQEKQWDGTLVFKTSKWRKNIKGNDLKYTGIPLKKSKYEPTKKYIFSHAVNTKGNYVNLYKPIKNEKPTE